MKKIKCCTCDGTGKLSHFNHIADGVCFACNGTGIISSDTKTHTNDYDQMMTSGKPSVDLEWKWTATQITNISNGTSSIGKGGSFRVAKDDSNIYFSIDSSVNWYFVISTTDKATANKYFKLV